MKIKPISLPLDKLYIVLWLLSTRSIILSYLGIQTQGLHGNIPHRYSIPSSITIYGYDLAASFTIPTVFSPSEYITSLFT
ncbi:hypothetical protein B0T12DRAFT_405833 [Alternaria alternata]|jgi:hypothetical protein|nr:hypothetical protein B0T12DRAFT_405833 [Alternaria alternata]